MRILASAVAGVAALLAAYPAAFNAVQWLGAAYLLWIGVRALRAAPAAAPDDLHTLARDLPATPLRSVFMGGFCTNVLNPKVALFFLAFLPQFIGSQAQDKSMAFLLLGLPLASSGRKPA